jgi:hypothetical protein
VSGVPKIGKAALQIRAARQNGNAEQVKRPGIAQHRVSRFGCFRRKIGFTESALENGSRWDDDFICPKGRTSGKKEHGEDN